MKERRPKGLSLRVLQLRVLQTTAENAALGDSADGRRPRTRGECVNGQRPCPWISCRHHLAIEARPSGSILVTFPDAAGEPDLEAMPETCSLDVAEAGGVTLEEVGELFGISRERIRQIEEVALRRLHHRLR